MSRDALHLRDFDASVLLNRVEGMAGDSRTRFRIFVQSPVLGPPFDRPQTVSVDRSPSRIAAGPTDLDAGTGEPLFYVLDAKKDRYPSQTPHHYDATDGRPWNGARHAAVKPGPDGHFDHLDPDTNPRHFAQAAVYASARFTLERWQAYFRRARRNAVRWHHRAQGTDVDAALELNPWSKARGARAGYGFLEFGRGPKRADRREAPQPLWRNFDVVAHEVGHSMLFSVLGFPKTLKQGMAWYSSASIRRNGQFLAFHESAGDLVAMIASLHHDTVIDTVLERSGGNLRGRSSVLTRMGELRKTDAGDLEQLSTIRNAANELRMSDVTLAEDGPHPYSLPLTGAIYGLLVDEFEANGASLGTRESLVKARDTLGELLARAWCSHLSPDRLTFSRVRRALLAADRQMGGRRKQAIARNFNRRGIR